jgi:hypothetical protein
MPTSAEFMRAENIAHSYALLTRNFTVTESWDHVYALLQIPSRRNPQKELRR